MNIMQIPRQSRYYHTYIVKSITSRIIANMTTRANKLSARTEKVKAYNEQWNDPQFLAFVTSTKSNKQVRFSDGLVIEKQTQDSVDEKCGIRLWGYQLEELMEQCQIDDDTNFLLLLATQS